MFKDIRLHGILESRVEYEAFGIGADTSRRFFFELSPSPDAEIRLFSPGNELKIHHDGVSHRGNGGFFCEYMFGIDQPLADLIKPEVRNRFLMFGTHFSSEKDSLAFSEKTDGFVSFDKLFFDGNAVCNYCFFVHSEKLGSSVKKQQENLLKLLGKSIKRATSIEEEGEEQLIEELYTLLNDPHAQLFLVKLVNIRLKEYRDLFRMFYFRNKKIPDDDYARLSRLADANRIDRYQQERIRIDVMYRQSENRRIVDEYKEILTGCAARGCITRLENARLTRLKTLSVRNKIPGALFHALDTLLKHNQQIENSDEPPYLFETREILEGMFLSFENYAYTINSDDFVTLLNHKKRAQEERDRRFEGILLDAGRTIDEKIRDGAELSLVDSFSRIITLFDKFDSTLSILSQLAFMETVRITEEMLKNLSRSRIEFEQLKLGLFSELFTNDILSNEYLGSFGKQKLEAVEAVLNESRDEKSGITKLESALRQIDQSERLFVMTLDAVRERIKNFYTTFTSKEDITALRREISEELKLKRKISAQITGKIFDQVIDTIRKEAEYIHQILPKILSDQDISARENFVVTSGLDRFRIEEMEREYFERHGLPSQLLKSIQRDSDPSFSDDICWD